MKLIPAIIQNSETGRVLMLGYMNDESISLTQQTLWVHFYSRSREKIWKKGETSGNLLKFLSMSWDCDQDAILVQAIPQGPTCHTGEISCFKKDDFQNFGIIEKLWKQIEISCLKTEKTKTKEFLEQPLQFQIRKLNEETCEVAMASIYETNDRLAEESADLLYRLALVWKTKKIDLGNIREVLMKRSKKTATQWE